MTATDTAKPLLYHQVKAHPTARLSPHCSLMGKITLGKRVAVMAGAHLRGDDAEIVVGDDSNLQEGCVVHVDEGCPTVVGAHSTVGHGALLHGCTIGENCLVGMSSTIMNGAVIGKNSVVGAGSLVTQGKVFPENSLIMGSPAKFVRTLSDEEVRTMCTEPGDIYVECCERMLEEGALFNPEEGFNFKA